MFSFSLTQPQRQRYTIIIFSSILLCGLAVSSLLHATTAVLSPAQTTVVQTLLKSPGIAAATEHFQAGNYRQALEGYSAALQALNVTAGSSTHSTTTLRSTAAALLEQLGLCQFKLKQFQDAATTYRRLRKLNPHNPLATHNLALTAYHDGKVKVGIELLQQTTAIDPTYVPSYRALGALYEEQGELEKALIIYRKVLELAPETSAVYERVGTIYRQAGDFDRALLAFQTALGFAPNNQYVRSSFAETSYNLALFHDNQGEYAKAISYLTQLTEIMPRYAPGYHLFGIIAAKQGETQKAASYFKKAIRLDATLPHSYYELGLLYEKNKYTQKRALSYFAKTLKIDPQFLQAYYRLAELSYLRKDYATAAVFLKKILEFTPDDRTIAAKLQEVRTLLR